MGKLIKFPIQKSVHNAHDTWWATDEMSLNWPRNSRIYPWNWPAWAIRSLAVVGVMILSVLLFSSCSSRPSRADDMRRLVELSYYTGCIDEVTIIQKIDESKLTPSDRSRCYTNAQGFRKSLEK